MVRYSQPSNSITLILQGVEIQPNLFFIAYDEHYSLTLYLLYLPWVFENRRIYKSSFVPKLPQVFRPMF